MTATGMYFEDYVVGEKLYSDGRTVTETDVMTFAGLSGDFNALHVDAVAAGQSPYGERIAHGLLVLSITSGLVYQMGVFSGTSLGLLGIDDWKFIGPVRFGDTIKIEMETVESRLSSKPGRGIVRFVRRVINQKGEIVQEGTSTAMVRTRPQSQESK